MILLHGARSDDVARCCFARHRVAVLLTAYTRYNLHNAHETGSWSGLGLVV